MCSCKHLGWPPFKYSTLQSTIKLNTRTHIALCFVQGFCMHTANFKLRGLHFCYSSSSMQWNYLIIQSLLSGRQTLHATSFPCLHGHFSLSGTSAEMFNKQEDPFLAQNSGCFGLSIPTVQFKVWRGGEGRGEGKNGKKTRTREKAKGTEKGKQTFNPWRGCKLCLQELNHLIVAAGATGERDAFNLMHYVQNLNSNIRPCSNCQRLGVWMSNCK